MTTGHDNRAVLGIEPRTSRTLSENHTTRPNSQIQEYGFPDSIAWGCNLVVICFSHKSPSICKRLTQVTQESPKVTKTQENFLLGCFGRCFACTFELRLVFCTVWAAGAFHGTLLALKSLVTSRA
eukprot:6491196-Amphidinium_carterae.1